METYIRSIRDVAKEALHFTHCIGQLTVMYAQEKIAEWDERAANAINYPDEK